MNFNELKIQLIKDEGKRLKVYKDSLGYLTVGIGHLVTKQDNLKLGDVITEEQCDLFFAEDINIAIDNSFRTFDDFENFNPDIQNVIINMMFNLGINKFSKFKKFIKALKNKNYTLAANEMKNSLWYSQVKSRGKRLEKIVRNTK